MHVQSQQFTPALRILHEFACGDLDIFYVWETHKLHPSFYLPEEDILNNEETGHPMDQILCQVGEKEQRLQV